MDASRAQGLDPIFLNPASGMTSNLINVMRAETLVGSVVLAVTCVGMESAHTQRPASGPAPGRLIDIGGRRIHLQCSGPTNAQPTVILLPGAGGFSTTWSQVQQNLTQQRTCAYDPAGLGWSDASSVARTLSQEAFDLHLALERANTSKPYVVVGHSMGGLVARIYAQRYPEEVAALVLVDPTHEDSRQFNTRVNRWVRVRELSSGRAVPVPSVGTSASANPSDDLLSEELQELHTARLLKSATFDDLPLFVLHALKREQPPGTSAEFWNELRAERDAQATDMVRLSRTGTLVRAEQSGHNIHIDEPELVARVIRDAIVAAQGAARVQR